MLMKSFEPVYKELEELFIEKLPEFIITINKKYNDQLILKQFENNKLEEKSFNQPYFKLLQHKGTATNKDRIIEKTVFCIVFEIKQEELETFKICRFWRYIEAIALMLSETETEFKYKLFEEDNFKFTIIVTVDF